MNITERNALIRDDYCTMTLEELSAKYGISKTQLSRICSGLNKSYSSKPDWVDAELMSGVTPRDIAVKAGIPIGTVRFWKRQLKTSDKPKAKKTITPTVLTGWDNKDWFVDQYITKKQGIPTIQKLIGKSVGFISDKLKEYGIERRSHKESMGLHKKSNRPSREWCIEHYVNKGWSIQKCSKELKLSDDTIINILNEFNIVLRDKSQQHIGELNSFFGKSHTEETRLFCAQKGSKYGKAYWSTGDIETKKKLTQQISKEFWADPIKRSEASARISEICKQGGCNSRQIGYITNSGEPLLVRSSWEHAVCIFLDSCPIVGSWEYEPLAIPYIVDDTTKHFLVDFSVTWVDGLTTLVEVKNEYLLSKESEITKLSILDDYCKRFDYTKVIVSDKTKISGLMLGYKSQLTKFIKPNFSTTKDYLELSSLEIEAMKHEIVEWVTPWTPPTYTDDELYDDLRRLQLENIGGYESDNSDIRSTAPNSGGMPGKKMLLHHQPHFLTIPVRRSKPLSDAFNHKEILYKSISISVGEKETLSFDRITREITHHFAKYGRTSHFAPGFARYIIRLFNMSGKKVFDPCCGWGGRLIGSYLEGCQYSGCDLSPETFRGLNNLSNYLKTNANILNCDCLECDWPEHDFVFTSPPFYDIEQYIGDNQPWKMANRQDWIEKFIKPFVDKCKKLTILYLDEKTKIDFQSVKKFDTVRKVVNRRHSRRKDMGCEYLCAYFAETTNESVMGL